MNLQAVLAPIVHLFEQTRIPYAVIGGYAVAAWGELRATRDVDFLCNAPDIGKLKSALKSAGYVFEHRTGDLEDPISDVIRIDTGSTGSIFEIDVLAGIRGEPPGLLQRSRTVPFQGMEVKVAGPEDMIILKLLGGSPLDLEDAHGILRVQKDAVSRELLRQICPDQLSEALAGILSEVPNR